MLRENNPKELQGQLVWEITAQVWMKMRVKTEAIKAKDYGLTLKSEQAKALVLFWQSVPPPLGYDYEVLVMERITTDLFQQLI